MGSFKILYLAWRAIRPYHGFQNDCYHGNDWVKLSGLNYIRAILCLHSALKSKRLETWKRAQFTPHDVLIIMNLNEKYINTIAVVEHKFNKLLRKVGK